DSVQDPLPRPALGGARAQSRELEPRRESRELRGGRERGNELREPAWKLGVQEVSGEHRVRAVGRAVDSRSPRGGRVALPGPEARQPEVELDECALRIEAGKLLETRERTVRPDGERGPDPGVERVVAPEDACRGALAA